MEFFILREEERERGKGFERVEGKGKVGSIEHR